MTIQEFHIAINQELDKTQDMEAAYMSPEQIDYWLNKGIRTLVRKRYGGNNRSKTSFEQTQKRIDDLRMITVFTSNPDGSPALLPVTLVGTTYYMTLPADYWYLVRLDITTQKGTCSPQVQPGFQAKQEDILNIQDDPFNKSYYQVPIYLVIGNTIQFPTDGSFQILGATPYYIQRPVTVALGSQYTVPQADVNCNLTDQLDDDIVNLTTQLMLENIEQQRVQTFSQLSGENEE